MNMGKAEVEVEVQNRSGSLLPFTGGVFLLVSFVLFGKFNY